MPAALAFGCGAGLGAVAASAGCLFNKKKKEQEEESRLSIGQPRRSEASSDAAWLNSLVERLWPRISEYMHILLAEKIVPAIDGHLPALARGAVKVTEFSLGKATPRFGPLTVRERERGSLVLDIDMDFESEITVNIHVVGMPVGIRKIAFSGVLSVVLQPPSNRPPFFGGIELYFTNPPDIRLDFTGALNVADCPGISGKIRSAIQGVLNGLLVTPNRVAVDMDVDDNTDKVDLQYPDPLGVLRFTLLKGAGLRALDSHLLSKSTSDPYVVAKIGQEVWTSPVISKNINPTWSEDNVVDMPIYEPKQLLSLAAYDSDWIEADDLMGSSAVVPAQDYMDPINRLKSGEAQLTYKGAAAGSLSYSVQWLTFAKAPEKDIGGPSQVHLTCKLDDAKGLPHKGDVPYTVLVKYEAAGLKESVEARTSPSKPSAGNGGPIADELRGVVLELSKRKMPDEDIAAVTNLSAAEIHQLLQLQNDPTAAQAHMQKVMLKRSSTHPHFKTVLQLLAPWKAEMGDAKVILELRNRADARVGEAASISIAELAAMKDCTHAGPFDIGKGGQIWAQLELRFLRTS